MKRKLWEYMLAVLVIAVLAGVIWLVTSLLLSSSPEVGTAVVKAGDQQVIPLAGEIYVTEKKEKKQTKQLVLEEIAADIPYLAYSDDLRVNYEGKSQNGDFGFTIYTEDFEAKTPRREQFIKPQEPGRYIVRIDTYWGTEKENIGMEYYFGILVSE